MTKKHWNKAHVEEYSKLDWIRKPSIFAEQCIQFFPKTGNILEIGAGQGGDARFFHSLGYTVTATDYSNEALKLAQARVEGVHFQNLDTEKGLPFEKESFDIVYSHLALHYFDAKTTRRIFEDIHRVLKQGGVFATLTNTVNDPEKEEFNYIELEPDYFQDPKGVKKRYFSPDDMRFFTQDLFEPIILDAHGATYKDSKPNLIRFIGKKI